MNLPIRAVITSVDFADLLALTLPLQMRHLAEAVVLTSPRDLATQEVARRCGASVYATDAFYRDGARFNKYRAVEECLDAIGRRGWLCLLDADVVWPAAASFGSPEPVTLHTPRRRMAPLSAVAEFGGVPPESEWHRWELHRNEAEFAGYSQLFHADDPHLGNPPWHQTDWRHAGGADSFFQLKWPPARKVRPDWDCLHVGDAGVNWCGRVQPTLDGDIPDEAASRRADLLGMVRRRTTGPDRFRAEKLTPGG